MKYEEIKEAIIFGNRENAKGNLFHEARDIDYGSLRQSAFHQELMEEIESEGEKHLGKPIEVLSYSDYTIFFKTGSRIEFEKLYFNRRSRLNALAILSLIHGDEKYVEGLHNIIWAICDEYSWCLPAHGSHITHNDLESIKNHKINNDILFRSRTHPTIIDLFSAETGFALCEIINMLEDKLDPLLVYRVKEEVRERIIRPYCDVNIPCLWEEFESNWASVCASSIGAAALYMIEDDDILAVILQRVLRTLTCYLAGFGEDGSCSEGIGYWNYGFSYFVAFAQLLNQRTAGKIDLMNNQKVRKIALFQQKCYLSGNKAVSFSDTGVEVHFRSGLTHFLKKRFDEVAVTDCKYACGFTSDWCYRWINNIRDLVWSNPEWSNSADWKDGSYYLEDAQWIVSRKTTETGKACFAAKGGHNDEMHNHNDVGSFIFHVNGESLLCDIGAGEYNRAYFGPERYSIFCTGSQGHSVPIVNGTYQKAGKEYAAKNIDIRISEEEDSMVQDISGAYACSVLTTLIRKLAFNKNTLELVLTDRYTFNEMCESVVERFISLDKPVFIQEGSIKLGAKSSSILIQYDASALEYSCKVENVKGRDVYVIDLSISKPQLEQNVEIRFVPDWESTEGK